MKAMGTKLVVALALGSIVAGCKTATTPPSMSGDSPAPARQISEITGVERIRYYKSTSGEGGRSGEIVREFLSEPGAEVWYYPATQTAVNGSFMRRDEYGNTVATGSGSDARRYPGPRGNGMAPTTAELKAGAGSNWKTVVQSEPRTTRECTLGGVDEITVGSETFDAVRWRCRNQLHDRNFPSISEFAGVRINGVLTWIEEKRCWTHSRASTTCSGSPGSYDGYARYIATAIER